MPMVSETSRLVYQKRHFDRLSVPSILLGILVPWSVFEWVYYLWSFFIRWRFFKTALVLGPGLGFVLAVAATANAYSKLRKYAPMRGAIALALGLWLAAVSGLLLGDRNYWSYMTNYYSFQDLATYVNVDPATDQGQTYMDGGQVYFKESTYVAFGTANAYVNNDIYCVAPIVRQPLENQGSTGSREGTFIIPQSGTIDFWAVGINCCLPNGDLFNCGKSKSTFARSGLRMLRDDVRPFFVMAVQEWASKYSLPTKHPLFFNFVEDPVLEVEGYSILGNFAYYKHGLLFAIVVAALTLSLHIVFFKLGLP